MSLHGWNRELVACFAGFPMILLGICVCVCICVCIFLSPVAFVLFAMTPLSASAQIMAPAFASLRKRGKLFLGI
jgi:hypothetical protein